MKKYISFMLTAICISAAAFAQAQNIVKGKIIDATTKEPVAGATIQCSQENCNCGCVTDATGAFEMKCKDCQHLNISFIGYAAQKIAVSNKPFIVSIQQKTSPMQEIILTANRGETTRRIEAPVAVSSISTKLIQDTKPTSADQLLNKISGVNMVSLNNEQHQMSIRQPMTTKSLFLYLEDGIPIRTSGLYNHNALLEMNLAATKTIEVIKGPSSSLYGSEAIGGVVNFITAEPTAVPVAKFSLQGNDIGYKKADMLTSFSKGKWGVMISGYYATKQNGFLEYSDFHKGIITAKINYQIAPKTQLSNSITLQDYYSEMAGGIDSTMFAKHVFSNPQTFTYRKVDGFRYRSTLTQIWNNNSKTTATVLVRKNSIGQNPAYRIKDDYRFSGGKYIGNKSLAHGEINESSFNTMAFIAQHKQNFNWKHATVIGGVNIELSPSTYTANYIRISKDTISKKYTSYTPTDSALTNYATKLNNYAAFMNFEFNPIEKLCVVASLRYDRFTYGFDNHLKPSAYSGSPDTSNSFSRWSPKIGVTYKISEHSGLYANYSEGFVPPQVTELYTGVKVPDLNPSIFYNQELGGWIEMVKDILSFDLSLYRLTGTNEIISVKQNDGSYMNQNTGKTLHQGIEFGMKSTPAKAWLFRISGAYSKHSFIQYNEKGISYNGYEMSNAPHWMYNAESWFKPNFVKGLRIGLELQHVGKYFVDPKNTASYGGYSVMHLRVGYTHKGIDIWMNLMNATNKYYSYITTKSAYGYSYTLAEPRNINIGIGYDLSQLSKKKP